MEQEPCVSDFNLQIWQDDNYKKRTKQYTCKDFVRFDESDWQQPNQARYTVSGWGDFGPSSYKLTPVGVDDVFTEWFDNGKRNHWEGRGVQYMGDIDVSTIDVIFPLKGRKYSYTPPPPEIKPPDTADIPKTSRIPQVKI